MSCLILSWRGFLTTKKKLEPKSSSLVEFVLVVISSLKGRGLSMNFMKLLFWTIWFGFLLGLLIVQFINTGVFYLLIIYSDYKIGLKDENICLFVTYFHAFFSASMTDKGSPTENDAQEAQLPFSREGDSGYSIVNNIPLPKNDSALNAVGNTDELMCHLG